MALIASSPIETVSSPIETVSSPIETVPATVTANFYQLHKPTFSKYSPHRVTDHVLIAFS